MKPCSCRPGKGTLFGIERLDHHIRVVSENYTKPCYVLKMDLQGYFMGINRQRLYDIVVDTLVKKGIDRKPEFKTMVRLLSLVIFNDPTKGCFIKGSLSDWEGLPASKSLFHAKEGCGLPIGNLTSQLFSNVYLNLLDQFVKRELHVKHYGRYVDDFYMVAATKEELLPLIPRVRKFLHDELFSTLHPKKIFLQEQSKGVPFLGCVLKNGRRYLSARARRLMNETLIYAYTMEPDPYRIRAIENSYKGYLSHLSPSPRDCSVFAFPIRPSHPLVVVPRPRSVMRGLNRRISSYRYAQPDRHAQLDWASHPFL